MSYLANLSLDRVTIENFGLIKFAQFGPFWKQETCPIQWPKDVPTLHLVEYDDDGTDVNSQIRLRMFEQSGPIFEAFKQISSKSGSTMSLPDFRYRARQFGFTRRARIISATLRSLGAYKALEVHSIVDCTNGVHNYEPDEPGRNVTFFVFDEHGRHIEIRLLASNPAVFDHNIEVFHDWLEVIQWQDEQVVPFRFKTVRMLNIGAMRPAS